MKFPSSRPRFVPAFLARAALAATTVAIAGAAGDRSRP